MVGGGAWCLEILGRVAIAAPGGARTLIHSGQVAAVLAMLWDEQRSVRRDELAELLWGTEKVPAHWAGAVRGVITKVRRVLDQAGFDPGSLSTERGTVRLVLPSCATTDVMIGIREADRAAAALRLGETDRAWRLATAAAAQLAEPLAIDGEGEWIRRLHVQVATHAGEARRTEIEALLDLGRSAEAVVAAEGAIVLDPLDEIAHELLLRALLAAQRPVAARRAHAELASALDAELGIEPHPQLLDAIEAWSPRARVEATPAIRSEAFFGRQPELLALHACVDDVVETERPGFVLVEGPAGIGKTHLVRTFLEREGGRVLWGRCRLDSGVPFEPVAEAFRRVIESLEEPKAADLDPPAKGLARLVPDLVPAASVGILGDTRGAVMRDIVGAVTWWAGPDPLILVIDDLQWASGDTVTLLGHILDEVEAPLLVVATVREGVAAPAEITEILRFAPTTVLALTGLTSEEVIDLSDELLAVSGEDIDRRELAGLLIERTGGLPFYLVEVARDIRRRGVIDTQAIPETVRAWVRRRVDALPEELVSLLEVAAIVGSHPEVGVIEACVDIPAVQVIGGLEQLVRLGFLTETRDPSTLDFPHQITREVVEDRIGAPRQARLHAQVADVLVGRADGEFTPAVHVALAHHYGLAGPGGRAAAAEHGFHAGAASLVRSAWSLADTQLTKALNRCDTADPVCRTALLVALGRTHHMLSRPDEAVILLDQACTLSVEHRHPHHLARATLQLVGRGGRGAALGMTDDERVARLRTALEAVTEWTEPERSLAAPGLEVDDDSRAWLRTALEAELAWALLFTGTFEARSALVQSALSRARAGPAVPAQLAQALLAQRNVLQGPGDTRHRLAVTEEILSIPASELPPEILIATHLGRHEDRLSVGDAATTGDALDEARRMADVHSLPYWRWAVATWDSLRLHLYGDAEGAETALFASLDLQPGGSPEAAACLGVQLVGYRLHDGRGGAVVEAMTHSVDANPLIPCYRAVLALCQLDAGDVAGARTSYDWFAHDHFEMIPVDSNRLLTMAALGDVAASLGDVAGAEVLDEVLAPDDDLHVVLNCYGGGGAYWGPVSRVRARLAALSGRDEDAIQAQARARKAAHGLGAPVAARIVDQRGFAQSSRSLW